MLKNKFKPISISLSPNVQKDDVKLALKLILQPWKWKQGRAVKELEEQFKKYLGVKYAVSFNSGRSSFYAILKSLNLPDGTDVILQAFTCNAVPSPILWAGLNPVYVDCADDFNINIMKLHSLIRANKGRVLVVQHTFGLPAKMDEIISIAEENNVILIEDCAHALGAEYNGRKVGTFGKAAFFSFSRDKVISCVYGGMAVTDDDELGRKLEQLQEKFGQPSYFWIFQQISHPILMNFIVLPLYRFLELGKLFLILSQWCKILSKAVSWKEKRGLKPDYFPRVLPNALAIMAQNQLAKIDKFYSHRKSISEFYCQSLKNTSFKLPSMQERQSFLRFSLRHPKAREIIYNAWHRENILLGDWYTVPIAPDDTKLDRMRYAIGMCPNAEKLSKETLNLPTHINISREDAKKIVELLLNYENK